MWTVKSKTVLVAAVVLILLVIPWELGKMYFGNSRTTPVPFVVDIKQGKMDMDLFRRYTQGFGNFSSAMHLENMWDREVYTAYHHFLDNLDILCRRRLRMGNVGDGGWEVCDDDAYRPDPSCIVYSFGINNDFSFDDAVSRLYGCNVFSFDPSMKRVDSHRRSNKVSFYKIGLGGKNGELEEDKDSEQRKHWTTKSLTDIKAMLNHSRAIIDIVKMDIEAAEWIALADMARSGELSRVRQLFVEFHIFAADATAEMRTRLPVLQALHRLGFRRFYSHMNPVCVDQTRLYPSLRARCSEVYFVNTNLARTLAV